MTREDYMNGKVTHKEFYRSVAHEAGISFANSSMLPKIKAALASGDEHLNTIPLQTWDALAHVSRTQIATALKKHGDFYSMAGGVCTLKAAAIEAAEIEEEIEEDELDDRDTPDFFGEVL